jgi:hypothetical protein
VRVHWAGFQAEAKKAGGPSIVRVGSNSSGWCTQAAAVVAHPLRAGVSAETMYGSKVAA